MQSAYVVKDGNYDYAVAKNGQTFLMYGTYPDQTELLLGCKYCDHFYPTGTNQ